MKPTLTSRIGIGAIGMLALSSCSDGKHSTETDAPAAQAPLSITYRSAYVAIGASNRLAIINMDRMEVRDTLSLTLPPGSTGSGMMNDMSHMGGMDHMSGTSGMSMMNMSWPHHLSLSPDGKKIAVAFPGMDLSGGHGHGTTSGMGGGVAVFDATTGTLLASATLPSMNHNAAWSPDGKTIWTSQMTSPGKVLILDTNLARVDSIAVGGKPAEITFDDDGAKAFVANGMSGTVSVIDVATRKVVRTITVGAEPVGAWQGMGGHMYVDNEEGKSIHHLHTDSASVLDSIRLGFTPGMAQMHDSSSKLWVTDADAGRVVCFHHASSAWHRSDSITTGAGAHAVTFTKDGSKAWITNQLAGTVSIIDTKTLAKIKDIPVGSKPNGILLREMP